ncbi:glycine N-acyltransferase-like protein 3 isoform X3 [Denticeps clupeoides]|uniref:glycine N-acyltransferase-like protein 3 isoform X3 n=1 Tax=Denticeps clupeoides TaxID=299321 RepID=UPI0010A36659|nr:glycine N-acyltransferase-like protein 3 isoform X3 [Denticeps clupeoides]
MTSRDPTCSARRGSGRLPVTWVPTAASRLYNNRTRPAAGRRHISTAANRSVSPKRLLSCQTSVPCPVSTIRPRVLGRDLSGDDGLQKTSSMIVLGEDELQQAEKALAPLSPAAVKVYGCLFSINRGKALNLEVVADSWPDFSVLVCKPKVQGTADREGDFNIYSIFSRDQASLKKLLSSPGLLRWDAFTLLAGVDINHLDAVTDLAAQHGVPARTQCVMHVLMLNSHDQLRVYQSVPEDRIRPLQAEHAALVNSTWKYGGDHNSYNSVLGYISNHPSLCVMDEGGGGPLSWVLVYHHLALGLLYTLPQHRRKGYAKTLRLHLK